eukprot:scpid105556/ scgid29235/ 
MMGTSESTFQKFNSHMSQAHGPQGIFRFHYHYSSETTAQDGLRKKSWLLPMWNSRLVLISPTLKWPTAPITSAPHREHIELHTWKPTRNHRSQLNSFCINADEAAISLF